MQSNFFYSNENDDKFDENENFISEKFKLFFKKPQGEFTFTLGALFFKVPDALCEYYNLNERITYTIMAKNIKKPLSYIGEYIRFHITGIGSNIEIIEDNIWLLKKNSYTLMQRYKFFVKDRLYYMTVYIMSHKLNPERKCALLVASPFELFYRLKDEGYNAYLNFYFMD